MPSWSALRKLIDEAAGGSSLHAVYQAALSCVQSVLGVERASLLTFDGEGKMRFVAWSSLSEEYRRAVDGHSPWSPDETNATPLLVRDVEADADLAAYLPVLRREGIGALAFIPLRHGTRLLGEFMLYHESAHEFSDAEVEAALQIADHVAFALEHRRLAEELEARVDAERVLRRQAETAESRLRLALVAGRMGAWEWDLATDRVTWSEELERIHGIEPGTFPGTLEGFRRDVYPPDVERLGTEIRAALAEPGSTYAVEYRITRPDGERRWVAARGRALGDGEGKATRMVGICRDVTQRKRMQEASAFLADVSRMLTTTLEPEATIENLVEIVVPRLADCCVVQVLDQEGALRPAEISHREAGCAARIRRLLEGWPGRSADFASAESVASTGQAVLIPRITAELLEAHAEDGEHFQALRSIGARSAITVPLQARGRILGTLSLLSVERERTYDGLDLRFAADIAGWAALAIDNAELYRQAGDAREAAEQARGRLEALAQVSDQIAISLDPNEALRELAERVVPTFADFCVTYAADECSIRHIGCGHRDPAKGPLVQMLAQSEPVSIEDPAGLGRVVRTGEPRLLSELSLDAPSTLACDARAHEALRALAPRSLMIVPLNARGRTLGAIAFGATEDSGRRFGQQDLTISMDLASRAALLVDNARLYAEAKAAVRVRDDLMAVVSHDLRDPLQSISAAAELLRLDSDGNRMDGIETIALASARMQTLIQDLLDVSLIDSGRLAIDEREVDLSALTKKIQTLFQPQVDAKRVRLECLVDEGLPAVMADGRRIEQVLSNLIGNAVKFARPGDLITVGAERRNGAIRVYVADSGKGIAEDELGKIFDRFWRGEHAERLGAGLGLAVAQGIVEAHGGRIEVQSRVGAGSTFHFTLRTCRTGPRAADAHAGTERRRQTYF